MTWRQLYRECLEELGQSAEQIRDAMEYADKRRLESLGPAALEETNREINIPPGYTIEEFKADVKCYIQFFLSLPLEQQQEIRALHQQQEQSKLKGN